MDFCMPPVTKQEIYRDLHLQHAWDIEIEPLRTRVGHSTFMKKIVGGPIQLVHF